jgi:hypothetical protein
MSESEFLFFPIILLGADERSASLLCLKLSLTLTRPLDVSQNVNAYHLLQETWTAPKAPGQGASVVVLDRGNCAFTKKALYAQNAGADAVIIVDNVNEDLVTMDASSDDASVAEAQNITVPVGLVTKATGDLFEPILEQRRTILVTLNWTDVLPHPDARVEWELWSNSGDNCGAKCDAQKGFVRDFASAAKTLEQGGYTQFTPHYVTWLCPPEAVHEDFCVKQCINNGRYCCPDPDDDFDAGYSGADVVEQNLRTLCVFRERTTRRNPGSGGTTSPSSRASARWRSVPLTTCRARRRFSSL